MFVPLWLIFLVSGTVMAVAAVLWAIASRQFDDQQRARFLPLVGLIASDYGAGDGVAERFGVEDEPRRGAGFRVTLLIVSCGTLAIATTLISALRDLL
jgi:hypothetical protein